MFSFLSMIGNYEDRKVARFEADWGFISTAQVNDGSKPYETAVAHEDYNDGKIIIVESYGTRDLALAGHERWIKTMTAKKLPDSLLKRWSTRNGGGFYRQALRGPDSAPRVSALTR